MGKELDLAGKGLFRDKRGNTKYIQLYRNAIDDKMFVSLKLKFVEVVKTGCFYTEI